MSDFTKEKFDELKSRAIYWREVLARPVNEAEAIIRRESQEAYAKFGYRGILTILSTAPLGYELAKMICSTTRFNLDWPSALELARQIKSQADRKE